MVWLHPSCRLHPLSSLCLWDGAFPSPQHPGLSLQAASLSSRPWRARLRFRPTLRVARSSTVRKLRFLFLQVSHSLTLGPDGCHPRTGPTRRVTPALEFGARITGPRSDFWNELLLVWETQRLKLLPLCWNTLEPVTRKKSKCGMANQKKNQCLEIKKLTICTFQLLHVKLKSHLWWILHDFEIVCCSWNRC